jgi:hypothetical protein
VWLTAAVWFRKTVTVQFVIMFASGLFRFCKQHTDAYTKTSNLHGCCDIRPTNNNGQLVEWPVTDHLQSVYRTDTTAVSGKLIVTMDKADRLHSQQ